MTVKSRRQESVAFIAAELPRLARRLQKRGTSVKRIQNQCLKRHGKLVNAITVAADASLASALATVS